MLLTFDVFCFNGLACKWGFRTENVLIRYKVFKSIENCAKVVFKSFKLFASVAVLISFDHRCKTIYTFEVFSFRCLAGTWGFRTYNACIRGIVFKNIVRNGQNLFSKVYNFCVKVAFSNHLTFEAKCYKLVISFVVEVWQVNEVFDPKMSLIENFYSKNLVRIGQNLFLRVHILRRNCILISVDPKRKIL